MSPCIFSIVDIELFNKYKNISNDLYDDSNFQFQDVVRLTSQLPNLVASYEVPFPQWSHLDFCWAIDADTLLYSEILKNMEEIRETVPEWNFD